MMFGLGADGTPTPTPGTGGAGGATVPGNTAVVPGFGEGVKAWTEPSSAVNALGVIAGNPTAAFSGAVMPFTLGLLAVPAALIAVVMSMGKK
jgi:hypothetical protein